MTSPTTHRVVSSVWISQSVEAWTLPDGKTFPRGRSLIIRSIHDILGGSTAIRTPDGNTIARLDHTRPSINLRVDNKGRWHVEPNRYAKDTL